MMSFRPFRCSVSYVRVRVGAVNCRRCHCRRQSLPSGCYFFDAPHQLGHRQIASAVLPSDVFAGFRWCSLIGAVRKSSDADADDQFGVLDGQVVVITGVFLTATPFAWSGQMIECRRALL